MRKIAREAARAAASATPRIFGNTRVEVAGDVTVVRLHGHPILRLTPCVSGGRVVEATLAGWPTPTTRSRLNDLFAVLFGYAGRSPRVWQERGSQRLRLPDETVEMDTHGWYVVGLIA